MSLHFSITPSKSQVEHVIVWIQGTYCQGMRAEGIIWFLQLTYEEMEYTSFQESPHWEFHPHRTLFDDIKKKSNLYCNNKLKLYMLFQYLITVICYLDFLLSNVC